MTLRARLTLGLLTIAVILIVPLISAVRSLDRVSEEAKLLRDGDFAGPLPKRSTPRDVYVYFDNTDKLQAPNDAQALARLLDAR